MPKKILAFAASNSATSINRLLVNHAADVFVTDFMTDAQVEMLDINDFEMPIYSPQREASDGIPALAQAFYDRISAADGLIIAFPEHNGSYPAAYKNLFDWTSRIKMKIYQDKPAVFLAASVGGRAGQAVLGFAVNTAPFFGARVAGSLGIGPFGERFNTQTGTLTLSEDGVQLRAALENLAQELRGDALQSAA